VRTIRAPTAARTAYDHACHKRAAAANSLVSAALRDMVRALMNNGFCTFLLSLVCLAAASAAQAHPHVWVTMQSEVLYAPDGTVTGVRHAWSFDDMFSAFATQGIETKQKGVFTRDDLAPLAEVNVDSLKDFDYFTNARANGKKAQFDPPVDYWLEYKDEVLILHFTLPFKPPLKAQSLDLEVYDPTYFVDFTMAEKDPVALVNAPKQCKLNVARPTDAATAPNAPVNEQFFNSLDPSSNFGAQFANKISVKCP
jgi:ABC-type uncharacterized transport system substrate-binding protein